MDEDFLVVDEDLSGVDVDQVKMTLLMLSHYNRKKNAENKDKMSIMQPGTVCEAALS